jgi:hypothetical protein
MADNGFDRISALLTFAFYGRDVAFLPRQNDLGSLSLVSIPWPRYPQIDLCFFWRNPAEP